MSDFRRFIITFEFSGENFFGSQKQSDKRTVQGELERALNQIINGTLTKNETKSKIIREQNSKFIKTIFSGRTDKGVSAKCQTAHFDVDFEYYIRFLDTKKKTDRFLYSLNSVLSDDIKVYKISEVEKDFHCQKSAKYKHYRYVIQNNSVASVFFKNCLFYPYKEINLEKMNLALNYLIGKHYFTSFKSKSDNPYDDCTIYWAKAKKVEIERLSFIFIDIIGDRFLYNMVRSIVGVLIYIDRHNLDSSFMNEILEKKNRSAAKNVAEAKGLTLEYVGYDDVNAYIENNFIKEGK